MRYILLCIILIGILGSWWWRLRQVSQRWTAIPDGQLVRVRGFITSQPYQKGSKQFISLGGIAIQTEAFPRYDYGDFLTVVGRLEKRVTDIGNPRLWLMYPNIRVADQEPERARFWSLRWLSLLQKLRRGIEENLAATLPEPQAALAAGVLLGMRSELPERFEAALRRTGTMHVVVASGYNVTVVAGVIGWLLRLVLPRFWTLPFSLLGILAYALMAGGDPPVVRAAIMGGLLVGSQALGRQYHGLWALTLTGLVMLVISPWLLWDVGFQLSLAATAGILTLTPLLNRFWWRNFGFLGKGITQQLGVTLGAQLAVLPILLGHFGEVSWLAPLVNLLVAWLVPSIMALAGLLGLSGFFLGSIAHVIALVVWVPLSVFVEAVSWFARLPVGQLTLPPTPWWLIAGYYAGLGWAVWWLRDKRWGWSQDFSKD